MFTKKSIFRMFFVILVILMMSGSTLARPLEAPLGTGFTYQGKLTDGGVPANGTYDFKFALYDALSDGSQMGDYVIQEDVTVTGGLFTVQLDFGKAIDGTALFLEIGVRAGASTGGYTTLSPRQELTATPYAIFASKASWSGLTEVPAGFADGVDNNTTYTAGDGLELDGTQFKGKGTSYQNVVIVAKSGGDFTTITAALDSITDAGDANRYLVYVAPGVYSEQVTMKPYVDIEGSGELTTKITYTGSASTTTSTVAGANNAELRFLTVENTGGASYAIAINSNSASPRLTHITASATGGSYNYVMINYNSSPTMTDVTISASGGVYSNYGVFNSGGSPTMTDVTASATGGSYCYGVYNDYSSPTMTGVAASASGGGYDNFGVYNASSSPTMTNVTASASGGISSIGVFNTSSSSPTMTNVAASASGGTDNNYGVRNDYSTSIIYNNVISASGGTSSCGLYNLNASATINNSVINASGGTNNIGIYNTATFDTYTVLVNNSQIGGSTATIRNDAEFTTRVGASQLSGGAVSVGGGTVTCIGVYDENYASPGYTTCP